ncbi:MAG: hypothetical protein KGI38_13010, partial [Thaumarchaeota archaeon]|nr:hypothetical protein [Nitrososphaerota archaeon]
MPTIRPSFEALPLVRRVLESEAGCGFKLSYYPGDHDWALHPTKDGAGIMSVSQRNGIIRLNGYFLYEADNVMEFQCPEELMIAMDD